jgi:preprotein translocase subunit YajC
VDQSWLSVSTDGASWGAKFLQTGLPLAEGIFGEGLLTNPIVPLVFIGLFLWLLVIRPERRRQSTHRQLLEGIKKNDKVVTIGGIRGTVVSVNREVDEVVVRVDDNAKMRFTVGAIARIEGEDAKKPEGS